MKYSIRTLMDAIDEEKLQQIDDASEEEVSREELDEIEESHRRAFGKDRASQGLTEYTPEMLEKFKNTALKTAEAGAKMTLTHLARLVPKFEEPAGFVRDGFNRAFGEYLDGIGSFAEFLDKELRTGQLVYDVDKYGKALTMDPESYIYEEAKYSIPKFTEEAEDDAYDILHGYAKEALDLYNKKLLEGLKEFFN